LRASYNAADEILPNLFLGNICAAASKSFMEDNAIAAVVTMSIEHDLLANFDESNITYYRFPLYDHHNDRNYDLMTTAFLKAAKACEQHLSKGERVLVHCAAGISRSASAVIAYMIQNGIASDFNEALNEVRRHRPCADPNPHFRRILEDLATTKTKETRESL